MKKRKILVIITLTFLALILLGIVFTIAIHNYQIVNFSLDEDFNETTIGEKIANPDRIVYRDEEGNYYEFSKDTEKYNNLKALLGNSIKEYDENGEVLTDDDIDKLHSKSFIEFDYKTISKNYIINLEKNENRAVVKLGNTGGTVVAQKIDNLSKIKRTLNSLIIGENPKKLEYKQLYSRNYIDGIEYKYTHLFNSKDSGIYQAKITSLSDYEKYKQICNIAIESEKEINEETFLNNEIILTVSSLPKIEVKVNVGNIKYNYSKIENANPQYTVHILIVSNIVNTDCIYNTNLSVIENQIEHENFKIDYDKKVENLDTNIFATNIDEFMKEYNLASSKISEDEASIIAEKGFEEAERICGAYDISTQTVTRENVKPNNFYTRKYNEGDKVYTQYEVDCYVFTRLDDMQLNGVKVYVDVKTGKIVGGGAFGD